MLPKMIKFILCLFMCILLSSCINGMKITDAKIAADIVKEENSEKIVPVNIANTFPLDTQKIACWFEWKDAKVDTKIIAKWQYITDDIHILDYTFSIPRKNSAGGISLSMPEGKRLPAGEYRLDLTVGSTILKTLTFKVG